MSPAGDSITITTAGPDDAAIVHAMVCELAVHEGSLGAVTSTVERWREMIADDRVTVLLAMRDEEAVGYVSGVLKLHLWSGEEIVALDDLYVRPRARNGGLGEVLIRALADEFPGRSLRWEIEEGNLAAQRFYVRLGAALKPKVVAWWWPSRDPDAPPRQMP